jgi:O-methyltransferase involved in polyketide biosynthesis
MRKNQTSLTATGIALMRAVESEKTEMSGSVTILTLAG